MIRLFNEEGRHGLLSHIFRDTKTGIWKQNRKSDLFFCQHHHSEGVGLVEIHTRNFHATGLLAFQLSLHGQVLGIVKTHPDGRQRLLFDRGEGLGDREQAEELAIELFSRLAGAVSEEEQSPHLERVTLFTPHC